MPRSLFPFLRWVGGLQPHPDLEVILDGSYKSLIRSRGLSLDQAFEACIEEKFLQDHECRGYAPTISDLLEMIAAEARGCRQYRIHEWGAAIEQAAEPLTEPTAAEIYTWMQVNPRLAATMLMKLKSPIVRRMIQFNFRRALQHRKRERARLWLFRRYVAAGAPFCTKFAEVERLPVATVRADLQIVAYRIVRGEIIGNDDMCIVARHKA